MLETQNRTGIWLLLFASTIIYGVGDVLLKMGNMDINSSIEMLLNGNLLLAILVNHLIITAFGLTLVAKLMMGVVLSKQPLGLAEGFFLALSVVSVFVLGIFFFGDYADMFDTVGIGMIVLGIILVYREYEPDEGEST